MAGLVKGVGPRVHAHPERPGPRQGEHVRRLDLGDPLKAGNPDLAFDFIKTMQTKANAEKWYIANSGISVRKDVAADPAYATAQPGIKFFTDLVASTHYRPAYPAYPKVSTAIQEAMEGVTTGDMSVDKAASSYDDELKSATDNQVTEK